MSASGPLRWYHTQIWLYGHWLPGDARGFRSRDHRIHSSGDYKQRPPQDEHAGLHAHATALLKSQPIFLSRPQRQHLGELAVRWFDMKEPALAAMSVGGAHAHLLCQLPLGQEGATIGKVKRYVSVEATRQDASIPSRLFAGKGEPKRVKDWAHFCTAYEYVTVKHAGEGAWVWGVGVDGLAGLWTRGDR